ncbi:MAG: ABC transporter permease [Lachnospiraceae bacterium]|nr:ABC transporter permease [Lachnospiraceae bacterium]
MLKRDMRLFLRGLIPAAVLTCLLVIACIFAGMAAKSGAERHTEPVKVAFIDHEDSVLSRISINMVTEQSYVASLMDLSQVDDTDQALRDMADGKYGAVVELPDGYMEKIMHGEKCAGKIYVSDAMGNERDLIRAVADLGSRILTAGQLGVFAGERVIREQGISDEIYARFLDNSNSSLITFALDAYDTVFSFEVLPYGETGISMAMYYVLCWFILILFIVGLFFPDLYISDCKGSIYSRLQTCGISRFRFAFGKILYPILYRIMLVVIAVLAAKKIAPECFGDSGTLEVIVMLAIVCIIISLITGNLAIALSKKGGWAVAILASSAVCLFMAGGLVPRTMLPEILPKLVIYTPFGSTLTLAVSAFGGRLSGFTDGGGTVICALIVSAVYVAVFVLAAFRIMGRMSKSDEEVRL